jgi:predicted lactoylglutathione lyase
MSDRAAGMIVDENIIVMLLVEERFLQGLDGWRTPCQRIELANR